MRRQSNILFWWFIVLFSVVVLSSATYFFYGARDSDERVADQGEPDVGRGLVGVTTVSSNDSLAPDDRPVTQESPESGRALTLWPSQLLSMDNAGVGKKPPAEESASRAKPKKPALGPGSPMTHRAPEFGLDIGVVLERPITDSWVLHCKIEYARHGPNPVKHGVRMALDAARKQRQSGQAEVPVDTDEDGVVDWWVYFENNAPAFVEGDRFQTGCRDLRIDVRKQPWKGKAFVDWTIKPPVLLPFPELSSLVVTSDMFDSATPTDHRKHKPGSSQQLARELFANLSEDLSRLAKRSAGESTVTTLLNYADKARKLYPRFIEEHREKQLAKKLLTETGWQIENTPYDIDSDGHPEIVIAFSPSGVENIQFYKKDWHNEKDWIATVFLEEGAVVRIDMGEERYFCLDGFWVRVSAGARRKIAEKHLLPGYRHFHAGDWYQAMAHWQQGSRLAALLGDVSVNDKGATADGFARLGRGIAVRNAATYWNYEVEGLPADALLVIARDLGGRRLFEGFRQLAEHSNEARDYEKALALYRLTLRFSQKQGEAILQGNALEAMSRIYVQMGNYDRAIDCLFRSLDLESSLEYALEIAKNLRNLVPGSRGRANVDQAMSIRAHAMAVNRGCKLGAIAALYTELGDQKKARGYLLEAERILKFVGHKYAEADLETIKAKWHLERGQWDIARDRLKRALQISMEQLSDQKQKDYGLELYERGRAAHVFEFPKPQSIFRVQMASTSHPLSYQANIAGTIAETCLKGAIAMRQSEPRQFEKQLEEAFRWQSKSLKWYQETENTTGILAGELRLAAIAMYREQFDEALRLARRTADESAKRRIFETLWRARALEGAVHAARGRAEEAIRAYEQAAAEIESVRRLNRSETVRRGLLGSKLAVYEELALLYHSQQKPETVWQCMERGKARTLLDVLAGHDIQPKGPEVVEVQRAQPLLFDCLFGNFGSGVAASSESSADYDNYLRSARERLATNEVVSLRAVNPVSFSEVQQSLGEGVLLVEYFATRDDLLAAVVSRSQIRTVLISGYGHAKLREKVAAIRELLRSPRSSYRKPSQELYNDLLAPCLAGSGQLRQLCIVPSGALNYLPFHALVSGDGKFVVEKMLVSYAPSASALCFARDRSRQLQQEKPEPALVVVASSATTDFPPLLYGELSGRAVARLQPVSTAVLVNENATETRVKAELPSAGIFHFEGHADLQPNRPMRSALILREDVDNNGRLEVRELFGMRAPHCRLAVLAACETRMGQWSQGDEMVGLTRAFLRAGVPTVVASIWKIQDKTSAQIMIRFHQLLAQPGTSKLEALAGAQREFIAGKLARLELPDVEHDQLAMSSKEPDSDTVRGRQIRVKQRSRPGESVSEGTSHPYYWAGLELIGDWN